MTFKKISVVLLLIISGALLSSCGTVSAPDVKNLTAKEAWAQTEEFAKANWHEDAHLVQLGSVTSNQSQSLDGRPRGWDFFVISESTKSYATFGYVSGEGTAMLSSGTYANIVDLPMALIPSLDDWKIDSEEAFAIATASISSKLETAVKYGLKFSPEKNVIVWTVSYGTTEVRIDATSGSIVQ